MKDILKALLYTIIGCSVLAIFLGIITILTQHVSYIAGMVVAGSVVFIGIFILAYKTIIDERPS